MTKPKELTYYAQRLSPKLKWVGILPISDWHYGNPLCSEKHIDKQIEQLRRPNIFGILNGDLIEAAIRTSKGEIYEQVGNPQDQRDWVIAKLKPVAKKILAATDGNHELRIRDTTGMDISADIAYATGCPYRRDGMLLKVTFSEDNHSITGRPFSYYIYFSHGYGGARTSGARLMKIERLASYIHADVYIVSHDHCAQVMPISYLMPDPRTREDRETGHLVGPMLEFKKTLVKSGASLKWGGYSERQGFAPSQLSSPLIKLQGVGDPWVEVTI